MLESGRVRKNGHNVFAFGCGNVWDIESSDKLTLPDTSTGPLYPLGFYLWWSARFVNWTQHQTHSATCVALLLHSPTRLLLLDSRTWCFLLRSSKSIGIGVLPGWHSMEVDIASLYIYRHTITIRIAIALELHTTIAKPIHDSIVLAASLHCAYPFSPARPWGRRCNTTVSQIEEWRLLYWYAWGRRLMMQCSDTQSGQESTAGSSKGVLSW